MTTYMIIHTLTCAFAAYVVFFHYESLKQFKILRPILAWDQRFTRKVKRLFK